MSLVLGAFMLTLAAPFSMPDDLQADILVEYTDRFANTAEEENQENLTDPEQDNKLRSETSPGGDLSSGLPLNYINPEVFFVHPFVEIPSLPPEVRFTA